MDMVLKRLMDTTVTPDPLHIPDSFANSKRPKIREKKETKEISKPLYNTPKQIPKESKQPKNSDKEKDLDFEPNPKKQKKEKDKSKLDNVIVENVKDINKVPQIN